MRVDNNSPLQLERGIRNIINPLIQRTDDIRNKIERAVNDRINDNKHRLEILKNSISSASPQLILKKGYASVSSENGEIIKSGHEVSRGSSIKIRFINDVLSAEAGNTEDIPQ